MNVKCCLKYKKARGPNEEKQGNNDWNNIDFCECFHTICNADKVVKTVPPNVVKCFL